MFFFLLLICNIVFFVEWGEGGEGVSQDVVLLGVSQDVVLLLCRVVGFTVLLVLLCCLYLPRSIVLSLPVLRPAMALCG